MINTKDFTERLIKIMQYHGLSASAFADRVGVQRSSISHLLSERNKPSLDFVMKLVSHFKEVDLNWLVTGFGSYPSEGTSLPKNTLPPTKKEPLKERVVKKIIIFYENGSFEVHEN